MMSEQGVTAWYRYPLVWLVVALPLSSVVFGVVMIVSANLEPDDLVVDDYYKDGMGINQRLQLDSEAVRLGVTALLKSVTDDGLVFSITHGSDDLTLTMFHVSDQQRDLSAPMMALSDGLYTVASAEMASAFRLSGVWYLEIKDETKGWRIRERIEMPRSELRMVAR